MILSRNLVLNSKKFLKIADFVDDSGHFTEFYVISRQKRAKMTTFFPLFFKIKNRKSNYELLKTHLMSVILDFSLDDFGKPVYYRLATKILPIYSFKTKIYLGEIISQGVKNLNLITTGFRVPF